MKSRFTHPLVLTVAVFAVGAIAVSAQPRPMINPCPAPPPATAAGATIATITAVLHSKVYVDTRFVGTAPYPLPAAGRLCTDESGEATISLSDPGKSSCILLEAGALRVTAARGSMAIALETGTLWCSVGAGVVVGAGPAEGISAATANAVIGVAYSAKSKLTTIQVWRGAAGVSGRPLGSGKSWRVPVRSGQQRSVTALGLPSTASRSTLSAADKIAIAKLQFAQTTG